MNDIETLLPHRDPFLLVDEIISADTDEIIGVKTYNDSFFIQGHFPQQQIVPGILLVESMGQCGGAGLNQLGIVGQALYGFASLEDVKFLGVVEFGKTVRMVIRNRKISRWAIKQSGTTFCDGKTVAVATWTCVRLK